MDSFDKECPRCHGKAAPAPPTGQLSPTAPTRPIQPPQQQQPYPQQYPQQHLPPQQYPQVVVQNQPAGVRSGIGLGAGLCIGCMAIPFIFFALISVLTSAGHKTALQQQAQEKTAGQQTVTIQNTSANITWRGSEWTKRNTIAVVGELKNSDKVTHAMRLEARIYDSRNVMVANGFTNETIPAGETKRFEIQVSDDTQTVPFTFKVVPAE